MLPKKITLNKRFCEFLRNERKSRDMSADELSVAINKSQGWLAQIERGRLKTIKRSDLLALYMHISGESKESATETLNEKLMYIEITEKRNLINSDGKVLNFFALVNFNQTRGHLWYAGENLREFIPRISKMGKPQIEADLKSLFSELESEVVDWIIRAFNDMKKTFSDEISQTNLFLTIKLALDVYNGVCSDYGLDKVEVNRFEMEDLEKKLSNPFVKREATQLKDINEYQNLEIDTVIKHFDFEEYMRWKNKNCYASIKEKMPIVFDSSKIFEASNYVEYDDIPSNLSNNEYLKIIRHLYEDLAFFYGKVKALQEDIDDLEEEIDDLERIGDEEQD